MRPRRDAARSYPRRQLTIWRNWAPQPHRVETFKVSTDPQLEARSSTWICAFTGAYNQRCEPFRWTKPPTRSAKPTVNELRQATLLILLARWRSPCTLSLHE